MTEKTLMVGCAIFCIVGAPGIPFLLDPYMDTSKLKNDPYFTIIVPIVEVIATTVLCQLFLPIG